MFKPYYPLPPTTTPPPHTIQEYIKSVVNTVTGQFNCLMIRGLPRRTKKINTTINFTVPISSTTINQCDNFCLYIELISFVTLFSDFPFNG